MGECGGPGAARSWDPAWPRADAPGPQTKGASRRPASEPRESFGRRTWTVLGGLVVSVGREDPGSPGSGQCWAGRRGRLGKGRGQTDSLRVWEFLGGVLRAPSSCHGSPVWVCPPPWAWVPRIAARWVFWGVREQAWARAVGVVTQRAGTCVWALPWGLRAQRPQCCGGGVGLGAVPACPALCPHRRPEGTPPGPHGLRAGRALREAHARPSPGQAALHVGRTVASERKRTSGSLLTVASAGAAASPLVGVWSQGTEHLVSHLRAPAGPASCRGPTERFQGC